jgi:hypothetical protein
MQALQCEAPVPKATAPLSPAFNVAVQTIARRLFPCGFDVAAVHQPKSGVDFMLATPIPPYAPSTLAELTAHIARTGRMLVSGDFSDKTIYADAETNFAFRAWHDWHHWKHQIPFTLAGEREVCRLQERNLVTVYGPKTAAGFIPLLRAEVIGQAEYYTFHGTFPRNQMAFVKAYLLFRDPHTALRSWAI